MALMSLQIYVQLKTREINNKDIIMKKLLKIIRYQLCLTSLLNLWKEVATAQHQPNKFKRSMLRRGLGT